MVGHTTEIKKNSKEEKKWKPETRAECIHAGCRVFLKLLSSLLFMFFPHFLIYATIVAHRKHSKLW